jgi:hypothetical protein
VGLPAGTASRPPRHRGDNLPGQHLTQRVLGHPSVAQPDRHRRLAQPYAARVLAAANVIFRNRITPESDTIAP